MAQIRIVLVEPLYEGNIGFTARVMKNFGFSDLVLVNPCSFGIEAYARASHAKDLLEHAQYMTFEEIFSTSNLTVATTGQVSKSVCHPIRMPYYSPREIKGLLTPLKGTISILFGREDSGLTNNEIKRCDLICTIPASPIYPIINISHAVGLVCYELSDLPEGEIPLVTNEEMQHLFSHIDDYLDLIEHPDFKREMTIIMIRRILARCNLTTRECSTIHGLLRRSEWHINPKDPKFD